MSNPPTSSTTSLPPATSAASIRRRLIGRLLIGTLLLCFAAGAATYAHLRNEATNQFDEALLAKAQAIAGLAHLGADGTLKLEFSERMMPSYARRSHHPSYFAIHSPDGHVLATSPALGDHDLPVPPSVARSSRDQGYFDLTLPSGRAGRAAWLRFQPATEGAPDLKTDLLLIEASERTELDDTLWSMLVALAIVAAGLSVGTILLVMLVVRDALRPLQAVGEAAAQIDAESLGFRFETATLDAELRPIGERLNDLLGRLEEAFRRERRFTANVAHELRTPIAELRALADVAVRWPPPPETAAKHFRDVSTVATRMSSVVASLLALVRSQAGQDVIQPEPVDLAAAVAETFRPFRAQAEAKGLNVDIDLPGDLIVRTDRAMLASLLGNLLSNAVSHSPREGFVRCRAQAQPQTIRLELSNTNPGVTRVDLDHLAEPFWRRDGARSEGDHAGIGLSLVKAYAAAIGLDVRFDVDDAQVFRVTVTLPPDIAAEDEHANPADTSRAATLAEPEPRTQHDTVTSSP